MELQELVNINTLELKERKKLNNIKYGEVQCPICGSYSIDLFMFASVYDWKGGSDSEDYYRIEESQMSGYCVDCNFQGPLPAFNVTGQSWKEIIKVNGKNYLPVALKTNLGTILGIYVPKWPIDTGNEIVDTIKEYSFLKTIFTATTKEEIESTSFDVWYADRLKSNRIDILEGREPNYDGDEDYTSEEGFKPQCKHCDQKDCEERGGKLR
jgi:hypothetical protein